MTRSFRSRLTARCGARPGRQRCVVPVVLMLEDRTLPSIQFTPAAYAMPANRPDMPLTSISQFNGVVEPFISVNPADAGEIALSSQGGIRVSTSAGGNFPGGTRFPGGSNGDTVTTYDSAGQLFWVNVTGGGASITIAQVDPVTGGSLSRHFVDQVPNSSFMDDKEWMSADPTNNNLYVIWTRFGPDGANHSHILMRYSSDHGVSWSDPVQVDNGSDNNVQDANVTVAPDHQVYAAYHSATLGLNGQPGVYAHDGKIVVVRFNNDLTVPVRSIAEVPGRCHAKYPDSRLGPPNPRSDVFDGW